MLKSARGESWAVGRDEACIGKPGKGARIKFVPMSDQTYLFIDGEYIRRIHREAMQRFFCEDGDLRLEMMMQQARASRAYFYDSLDDALRQGESDQALQHRIAPLVDFFNYVRGLSGFHLRQGSMTGRGKKRRQKEVDILLAVDMLTHGFNGSMQKAILVSGDLDFRPIIETLVRQGIFVQVWFHRSSIARELPGAADFGHEIRFRQLYEWNGKAFQDAHRIPWEQNPAGAPIGDLIRSGILSGLPAELRKDPASSARDTFSLWVTIERGHTLRITDCDEALIERYAATQYASIEWNHSGEDVRGVGGSA